MAVVENYPQLKSDQNFRDLQAQLEGTENRIAVARNRYIQACRATTSRCAVSRQSHGHDVRLQAEAQLHGGERGCHFQAPLGRFFAGRHAACRRPVARRWRAAPAAAPPH